MKKRLFVIPAQAGIQSKPRLRRKKTFVLAPQVALDSRLRGNDNGKLRQQFPHLGPAQNMDMEMRHGLRRVRAVVGDEAVAACFEA